MVSGLSFCCCRCNLLVKALKGEGCLQPALVPAATLHAGETMISGYTGEAFRTDIFIGPVYYQRLRHMVSDKFQVGLTKLRGTWCWMSPAFTSLHVHCMNVSFDCIHVRGCLTNFLPSFMAADQMAVTLEQERGPSHRSCCAHTAPLHTHKVPDITSAIASFLHGSLPLSSTEACSELT